MSQVYPNIQTSPAPKLIIRTDYAVSELPIADDTFVEHKIGEFSLSETLSPQYERSKRSLVFCLIR